MKEENKVLFSVKKELLKKGYRLLYIGTASWANKITEKIEKVNGIWILGWEGSERPLLVNKFRIVTPDETRYYKLTTGYSHCNIARFCNTIEIQLDEKIIVIDGQEFCNPLTANHIFEGNERDMKPLVKATLLSQNFDDAYTEVDSVRNGYVDKVVYCNYALTPLNAPPISLMWNLSPESIRNMDSLEFNDKLRHLVNIKDDEIYAKSLLNSKYELISKDYYRKHKDNYSTYYPTYDSKFIKAMDIKIPKDYFDLGVFGLGSAGTAILDTVCRANWFQTIFLCDNDIVEAKNMINQWYTNEHIYLTKVSACKDIIGKLNRDMPRGISTRFTVRGEKYKFQQLDLEKRKFKYVVSGFDTIETRQEFLQNILDGKIEADYLIDCRYLDLACSVYFIDLHNTEQVYFYKANLDVDGEPIKKKSEGFAMTPEQFDKWVDAKGYYRSYCYAFRDNYLNYSGECDFSCRTERCKNFLYDLYKKSLPNNRINPDGYSCVKYNYIDIYKYVGAIVFGAIRSIENETGKPFTAIEAQTGNIPNYMVVKE